MQPTFRERYCQQLGLPADQFERHVFRRALYPHAWLFWPLLQLRSDHFAADFEFLRAVADLRSRRFFSAEAAEFHTHSANRNFSRRVLRLRVSAERTRRVMERCWGAKETTPPLVRAG